MASESEGYIFGPAGEVESHPLIPTSSSSSSSTLALHKMNNTNPTDDDFMLLPEMPLQPTISEEAELFFNRGNATHGKGKAPDIDFEETLSEFISDHQGVVMGHSSMMEHQGDPIRRTNERRRRDRIKNNVRTLQELMPHCKKKDRASILEDAAEYIKALKYQVEMMKAGGSGWAAPCMPVTPITSSMGTEIGIETIFGSGMLGVGYSAQYTPIYQVPSPGVAFLPSMPTTFTGSSQQVYIESIYHLYQSLKLLEFLCGGHNLQSMVFNLAGFWHRNKAWYLTLQASGISMPHPQAIHGSTAASYSALGIWNRTNSIY